MMIPLRRAFIVKQHGKLTYPEGTACAEVLIAGEKGGATAKMVFVGFGIAFVYKFLTAGAASCGRTSRRRTLYTRRRRRQGRPQGRGDRRRAGAGAAGRRLHHRPADRLVMMAGGGPVVPRARPADRHFGENADAGAAVDRPATDKSLIRNMEPGRSASNYLRYIGAGAVAAGGIISMFQALPLIVGSIVVRPARPALRRRRRRDGRPRRTERDLPLTVVVFGSLGLVVVLAAVAAARASGLTVAGRPRRGA